MAERNHREKHNARDDIPLSPIIGNIALDATPDDKPPRNPPSMIAKGAKWGAIAGFIGGEMYLGAHSPLGFYGGNVALVFLVTIGLGTAFGAAIGWAIQSKPGYDDFPPSDRI